jgi:serine phosphatase RsbU (regulator of sigma subunit)/pSer/pThr/pTyr-binding forkhead associated (FHA) protein
MASLTVNNGPETNKRYDVGATPCVMGRHPECSVVIDIGAVSRHHAQIVFEGGKYFVEDLNSRNGTFLNEQPVTGKVPLNHGDKVRICDTTLTFQNRAANLLSDGSSRDVPSGFTTLLVDDEEKTTSSTVMSRLDVSLKGGGAGVKLSASPEAKLSAILEISHALGRALALDDVLPKILNGLFKIFVQADRGFIVLREESGRLVPRWTKVRREENEDTIRISRTICNHVMEQKEAILSADAANDQRFEMSQSIADFRIRSMMCAPLVDSEGNAFGVLQIDTLDQRHRFQKEDLEVLGAIASQAAIAIDNAKLHDQSLKQREMERDLELAHEVQRGFLPDRRPELAGFKFYDFYAPAAYVGGDYYDYVQLPDGRTAVLVADVVGHGVAAALMMAKLSSEVRIALASGVQPGQAITTLNDRLCRSQTDRFVTFVMVAIDPKSGEVTIVNAGHMCPIVRRKSGAIDEPGHKEVGLPLGIAEGLNYEPVTITLSAGESVVLYTDGVNESMDLRGEFFGIDRIRRHVQGGHAPEPLGQTIIEDVRRFVGRGPQNDDMCLVCFGRD